MTNRIILAPLAAIFLSACVDLPLDVEQPVDGSDTEETAGDDDGYGETGTSGDGDRQPGDGDGDGDGDGAVESGDGDGDGDGEPDCGLGSPFNACMNEALGSIGECWVSACEDPEINDCDYLDCYTSCESDGLLDYLACDEVYPECVNEVKSAQYEAVLECNDDAGVCLAASEGECVESEFNLCSGLWESCTAEIF